MPALKDCTPSNGRSMDSKSSSSFSDQGSASDVFQNYSTSHKAGTSCSWGSLFSFTKKTHAGILLAALVATALNAFLKTLLSVFLGRIFDVVSQLGEGSRSGQSALAEVSKWCIVLAGLGVGNWMASASFLSLWIVFGELQANEVRKHVTSNLLSRDVEWVENLKDGIEGLHIRIHTQTRDLQLALSQVLGLVICDTVTSCASLGIAFYYSWKLTLVLMSTLPVSFMVLAIATRNLDSEVLSQRQSLQKASTIAAASFNGIDVVRVFSGFNREQKKYGDALRLAARHFLAQARCNSIQMGYLAFWSISIFVLGFWYGLVLVEQGLLPGHVLTTFYAVITAFNGVESFAGHWLILSKGKSAAHFLVHLARSKKDLDITARAEPSVILRTCAGSIQLNQVDFAYQSNLKDNNIRGVTMHIPAKQFTFLIGESGSGKSTVCSLMANLLTPIAGEVSIDGHPVDHIQPSCLSRHVSLIHQNSSVMHDSFFNNVACGSRCPDDVSETEVRQACTFVQLESTISQLHSGLDTIVGADNHSLSGGQKQRLALARARMRNPAILILDEPTSALDPIGKNIVMNAIREWRKDKTTIVVTHDISSIRDEDFVFVMRSGTILRQGRMQDLRNAVTAPCIPKSCTRSDQANLMSASSTLKPHGKGSFHNVANVSETEYQQITLRSSSSIQSAGRHASISRSRTKDTRKSLIEGWRITDDVERKQQQFSTYLDRHFCATETSYVLEKRHACTKACFAPGETIDNNDQISESSDSNFTGDSSMERKPSCRYRCAEIEGRTSQPDPRSYDSIRGILSTFWPSLGFEDRILCVLALFLCLLAAAATPAFSFCLARLLGAMWSKTDKVEQGLRWALFLIGIAVTDGICTGGGHYLFDKVSQTWIDHLRRDIFGKVLIQPKLWCQATQHSPGHLSRCLDRNAQEMRSVVGKFLPVLIVVVAIMSMSVVWAMTICWKLALVALSPLPLFVLAIKMYIMVSSKWEQKCNEAASDSSATLKEILLNFSLIRVFELGQYFDDKQTATANKAWRVGLERALYTGPWFGLYQSLTLPLTALVFYYGTSLTSQNTRDLNVNDVLQVINLLLFSIGTSFELLNGLPQLTAARVAATELLDYAKSTKTMDTSKHFLRQPDSPLPIEMHKVNFTPEQSSAKVLNEFSHVIDPGSCVAVVGSSGSGKTTVLSLILGLTTPDSSIYAHGWESEFTLCFGGVPYSILDLQHVRSMMAYVPQQPFLFPATIRDNIAYGVSSTCPNLVQEAVVQAAQSSGIHKFIVSLPDGYDTVVGDGGQALSGGQAQLVNIARALAKRPRLLILDEPTSALDSESALDVRIALRSLIRSPCWQEDGMALVIATHSIEMIQMAAEVVVLDKGVKVEQGTYGTLMASRSHLWRLINEGST